MPRYRALIEYDGTDYYGYQRQIEGQPTIQGEIENVLNQLTRQPIAVTGAGRTDSGVHATGQVISFTVDWRHGAATLQKAINANLPRSIAVLQLSECRPDFHPRYDARCRVYEYHFYQSVVHRPLLRHRSWQIKPPFDMAAVQAATAVIIGEHDFATFGQPPQGINSVRQVLTASWTHSADETMVFTISANAFLYRMVRSIVGSLKKVGDGSWTVNDFVEAFQARERSRCAPLAPAYGLYLVAVAYDED